MELKLQVQRFAIINRARFNRTFMELKCDSIAGPSKEYEQF